MSNHVWTEEMDNVLKENYPSLGTKATAELINKKFNATFSPCAIKGRVQRIGIKTPSRHRWTKEIDVFFKEQYPKLSVKEMQEALLNRFDHDVTERAILNRAHDLNVKSEARFHWTEEMDIFLREYYPTHGYKETIRCMKEKYGDVLTEYSIGDYIVHSGIELVGRSHSFKVNYDSPKRCKIGTETERKGVIYVKVSDNRNAGSSNWENWQPKRRAVWESVNGPIPKGYSIISLDQDPNNCDISNLRCIPKKYYFVLVNSTFCGSNNIFDVGGEILDTAIAWCDLYFTLKEIQNKKERAI